MYGDSEDFHRESIVTWSKHIDDGYKTRHKTRESDSKAPNEGMEMGNKC